MAKVWQTAKRAVHGGVRALVWTFTAIVGRIAWTAPAWVGWTGKRVLAPAMAASRRPRVRLALAVVVVGAVGGSLAYYYWPRPPEPVRVAATITSPGATPLRADAKPDVVSIQFESSVAPLDEVDKVVSAGVTVQPAVAGEWRWRGDAQLEFTPVADWAVGQEYRVSLARQALADHVLLETDEFTFRTADFGATLEQVVFHQDPTDSTIKKVVATLRFTHPIAPESLDDRVEMLMNEEGIKQSRRLATTILYDDFGGQAFIHSENLALPKFGGRVGLRVGKGLRSRRGGSKTEMDLSATAAVPGRFGSFTINDATTMTVRNQEGEPDQVLVVQTSADVEEQELVRNLQSWLLPIDRPALGNRKEQKGYKWSSSDVATIGAELLQAATPVGLTLIPGERARGTTHAFRIDVKPHRYLYVRVHAGIEAFGGYALEKEFNTVARVVQFPKELEIMHSGSLLSITGQRRLSVLARGLPAMKISIARVLEEDLNHLISQTTGGFDKPDFRENTTFNEKNISEVFSEVRALDASDLRRSQYVAVDFSKYLRTEGGELARGLFFLQVQGWDPKKKELLSISDERFVLVTDLGVLEKKAVDGSRMVFVQSIGSGEPVVGARVDVLGLNGLSVVSRATQSDGAARFDKIDDFKHEQEPVAFVVRAGADASFLPLGRHDRAVSLSRFDTGGERSGESQDRLSAYLFSDRGIYRPGDTFYIGTIVKSFNWRKDVARLPIEMVVTDARGIRVHEERVEIPENGFFETSFAPETTAPTGVYRVDAFMVKDDKRDTQLGTTHVRVEEFLPDRLRIRAQFAAAAGGRAWIAPGDATARVELENLFGTPAADHRVTAEIRLSPVLPALPGYDDFQFFDPARAERSHEEEVDEVTTNADGEAEIHLDLARFANATYRLSLLANGFELEGGRSVAAQASVTVSPNRFLVGYKSENNLSYLKRESSAVVDFVAVGADLQRVSVDAVQAVVVEKRYVSVLTRQANDTFQYESKEREFDKSIAPLQLTAAGAQFVLPTHDPGDFFVALRNSADVELCRVAFSVAGAANLARSLERTAELDVKLDRADYRAGDVIEVNIKAPYVGAGLISIERDRVYTHKWFRTATTTSVQKIRVPDDIEGNGYVNVTFVRDIASPEIYMSPMSTGVVPFTVARDKRTVQVGLEAPRLVSPGDEVEIQYWADRPCDMVVFAVDEGILQVADFATPDPLAHFFRKRALEVETSQILDLILPELDIARADAAAGGGDFARKLAANLNPFERKVKAPVAYWSGILKADAAHASVKYRVPDYFNGRLRIMAVAVAKSAVGVAEKTITVRGSFVIFPNLPLAAGPNDTIVAGVSVANNIADAGEGADVEISIEPSEHLQVLGASKVTIPIAAGRQGKTRFTLQVLDKPGAAEVRFTARLGKRSSHYVETLSVRPPTPMLTTVKAGKLQGGRADIAIDRQLYPHFRTLEVSVSPLPLSLSRGLRQVLENFPFLCTEQLVSAAVPSLVLGGYAELGYNKDQARQTVARAIGVLAARQNERGAFGFWAANSYVSDVQTVYAVHFLTEAAQREQLTNDGLLQRGLEYLRGLSRVDVHDIGGARTRAYAIYVLARNGEMVSQELTQLMNYLDTNQDGWRNDSTALFVASTLRLMQATDKATALLKKLDFKAKSEADYSQFYDDNLRRAQMLFLVSKHFPDRLPQIGGDLIDGVVGDGMVGYNTFSSGFAIYGLEAYARAAEGQVGVLRDVKVEEITGAAPPKPLALGNSLMPKLGFSDTATALRISSTAAFPIYYQVSMAGFDRAPPTAVLKDGVEIVREFRAVGSDAAQTAGADAGIVKVGQELDVVLTVRATWGRPVWSLAVVDMLPAGFEPVLLRGSNTTTVGRLRQSTSTWKPNYADVREDRVLLFGRAAEGSEQFVYRIRATARGQFGVPPTFASSMYDRSVMARSLGATLRVEDE